MDFYEAATIAPLPLFERKNIPPKPILFGSLSVV